MTKIYRFICLAAVLILSVAVVIFCVQRNSHESLKENQGQKVDDNYSQLENRYILPAFTSGMLSYNWDNPNEIKPYQFVLFYACDKSHRSSFRENPETLDIEVSAESVEQYASDFFNVSSDRVKQAEEYDSSKKVYLFSGMGGGSSVGLTDVSESDGKLILDYECYGGSNDERLWFGSLTMDISNPDQGVYLSNQSSLDSGLSFE